MKPRTGLTVASATEEFIPLVDAQKEHRKAVMCTALGLPVLHLRNGAGVEFEYKGKCLLLSAHNRHLILWKKRQTDEPCLGGSDDGGRSEGS
jgi:hypothetical protein